MIFNQTFNALLKEAHFTKEMLGSGATQIRKANYASQGIYFQAFTSLSTGLERIGKLCLMLDYYIEMQGRFPDSKYLKNEIRHNLLLIYKKAKHVINNHSIPFKFLKNIDDEIYQNILTVLSDFAEGDRYSNINLLVGNVPKNDPIATWFDKVDQVIFRSYISDSKRTKILQEAQAFDYMSHEYLSVLHLSESGNEMTSIQDTVYQTRIYQTVAPYRQLFVIQIIRFWVELLYGLQYKAMEVNNEDIPFFNEIFASFYNEDSVIKTHKLWDKF